MSQRHRDRRGQRKGLTMNYFMQKTIILVLVLTQVGCQALFERRKFADEMDRDTDGIFVPGRDFYVVEGDSGRAHRSYDEIMDRTPQTEAERRRYKAKVSLRQELSAKEATLSDGEYARYQEYWDELNTTSKKIYYLDLKNDSDRKRYIQALTGQRKQAYKNRTQRYLPNSRRPSSIRRSRNQVSTISLMELSGVKESAIGPGMSMDTVVGKWGGPERIDVAGRTGEGNERWTYYRHGRVRQIYFENGRVSGWDFQ